ncbi:hypothetical protein ACMCLI_000883 [Campylobacter jejuni]
MGKSIRYEIKEIEKWLKTKRH